MNTLRIWRDDFCRRLGRANQPIGPIDTRAPGKRPNKVSVVAPYTGHTVHFLDIIACERAEQIITDYKSALPTPLRLFGEDVPWSPSQLYVRSQLKPHLEWWLEVRPALIGMNEDELESILKQKVDNTPSISRLQRALLEGVATHYNSGALRELERAQIMLAIRLYQSENGTLPESLEQLQPLLDNTLEPGTFQLHKEGEQLVVESEARQIWILR